jgi:hypothetical protein
MIVMEAVCASETSETIFVTAKQQNSRKKCGKAQYVMTFAKSWDKSKFHLLYCRYEERV